ncbi:MAG: putative Nudix hydrolase NudL [Candidatus Erwinia impunctatus]|nr:putative Nudix hydrolase NudL [Culicoides impunctatus]
MKMNNLSVSDFLNHFLLHPPPEVEPVGVVAQQHAAVLIGIVDKVVPTILLTLRDETLRHHPGQVAFPGGMREAGDLSPANTALRETEEEICLPANTVNIAGSLAPVFSHSGVSVTPIVGIIPGDARWQANTQEVAAIFEIPLCQALDITNYHGVQLQRQHPPHQVWFSWYGKYCIWGMTAAILRSLGELIIAPSAPYPEIDKTSTDRERLS